MPPLRAAECDMGTTGSVAAAVGRHALFGLDFISTLAGSQPTRLMNKAYDVRRTRYIQESLVFNMRMTRLRHLRPVSDSSSITEYGAQSWLFILSARDWWLFPQFLNRLRRR
jgi:hypothetical protein